MCLDIIAKAAYEVAKNKLELVCEKWLGDLKDTITLVVFFLKITNQQETFRKNPSQVKAIKEQGNKPNFYSYVEPLS